jgi:integrase
LASRSLASIRGKDIADYIHEREAAGVGPNTVRLELALLSHLFTVARSAWGLESLTNPIMLVKGSRPKLPRGRDRRLLPGCTGAAGEEERLLTACEAYGGPIAAIVTIAIETAMRRGEIAAMRWEHLDRATRVLRVPETKTGVPRRVPLSSRALAVLDVLPRRIDGYVWGVRADSVTQAFIRAVAQAHKDYETECTATGAKPDPRMLRDLRFHDLRHEATNRLFERGLNPMEVSAITGHKTLQMLKRYTHLRAEDLVDRLG